MDSTLCASADPGNFLVVADANHQSRCTPDLTQALAASLLVCRCVMAGHLIVYLNTMHCSVAEVSAAALQEMNPLVKVNVQPGALNITNLSFLASYQVPDITILPEAAGCRCMCYYVALRLYTCNNADVHD